MNTIEVNGRDIKVRSLTRGEIKGLQEFGFNYVGCLPTFETATQAQDKCFEMVLNQEDIDYLNNQANAESTRVWKEILKETYGASDEEKNSSGTSDGTQIESE